MRSTVAVLLVLGMFGCGDDDGAEDAGTDAPSGPCSVDVDCNDGTFCNGDEACDPGNPAANERGCVPGAPPCTTGCNESEDRCLEGCMDADGDGAPDSACGGNDCDDSNPNRYPGNTEVCDVADLDEDCDPSTFGFRDIDMDTYPDIACCNDDNCGTDCNDAQPGVHPGEAESCDGLDNDCDGDVDEGALRTFWPDEDNDTFGDPDGAVMMACNPPPDYVENDEDCDDGNGAISPGAAEVCDSGCMPDGTGCEDENCDDVVETDCTCTAGETQMCDEPGVCSVGTETCDAGTGTWGACSIVGMAEICNGLDDDCNGVVDDADDAVKDTCWADADGDGYAAAGALTTLVCGACTAGYTDREPVGGNIDCNDDPAANGGAINPGAAEICDGYDNDCSTGGGALGAEDGDGDGHTDPGYAGCTGGPFAKDDCNDRMATVHGGQASYYGSPTCPNGTWDNCGPVNCPSGYCTTSTCGTGSCTIPKTNYDYNCNGSDERAPRATGCTGPTNCMLMACPSVSGPSYSGLPDCGDLVQYVSCGCGGSSCSFNTSPFLFRLGCH